MYVGYDPSIIQTEAGRLYTQANKIVGMMTLRGALGGFLLGLIGGGLLGAAMREAPVGAIAGAFVVAVMGAIGGYQLGQTRAFFLRLEAQRMLVLAQIEMNTRPR